MANWEFLLQKKGDRRWGTAHKPTLKLKAGSYRIAAQGQPNAEVHIEIIYETQDDQGNPLRRSQNRIKATNHKGLMAIMPFTQFKPGLWQIVCRSLEVASPWEYSLRLDILPVPQPKPKVFRPLPLPPNPNLFSFEASLSLPETTALEENETEETILERSLAQLMAARADGATPETLREVVEHTLKDLETTEPTPEDDLDEWEMVDETASGLLQSSLLELEELLKEELEPIWQEMEQSAQVAQEPIAVQPPFLGIRFDQPVYTWQSDQPVEIQGTIASIAPIPAAYADRLQHLQLRFTLFNPQNSEKLVSVEQDIIAWTENYRFQQAFTIHNQSHTLAILGEMVVVSAVQPSQILATQGFHLIADYQAIAAQIRLPDIPEAEEILERPSSYANLDLPNPTAIAPNPEPRPTERRSGSILPPKLGTPHKVAYAPQLPKFMQSGTTAEPDATACDQVGEAILEEFLTPALPGGDAPISFAEPTPAATVNPDEIPYPFVLEPEEIAAMQEPEEPEPETDIEAAPQSLVILTEEAATPEPPAAVEESEAEATAADLDWNSRFFSRLNALAADTDATWLQEPPETVIFQHHAVVPDSPLLNPFDNEGEAEAFRLELGLDPAIAPEDVAGDVEEREIATPPVEVEARPFTMEIVVDDEPEAEVMPPEPEPMPPLYDASGLPYPQAVLASDTPDNAAIAPMQTLPEPMIHLSKPEYQAEDVAVVRVTIPSYPDRIYVKLWMQDRQTRVILVGPLQLTDFTQDETGQRETLMQIPIPPGAVEVRFEAIAINPRLQQESRKVGVDRRVVPKDFAEINWDDLGI